MSDDEPDIEFYTLPSFEDIEHWEKVIASGVHQPLPEPTVNGTGNHWQWLNLTDPQYAIPPDPPAVHGLLYHSKRHVLSGPQESAKTLIAYWLLLQALEQGHQIAILDFEMGPVATRRMLTDLGATDAQLPLCHYTEPTGPPTEHDLDRMLKAKTDFVLVDASAGAFDTSGLDDNSRKDAEQFARQWIQPLFREGIATIVLDHVTKNTETRGKYAIGSERKTGGADVHLGLEALKTLTRGGTGIVKVTAHKDRGAYMQRPTVAMIELASDADTHAVNVTVKPPEIIPADQPVKHTIYAERVSRTLEQALEPMSQTKVEEATEGNATYVRQAILELHSAGHISIEQGPRNAKIITLITPYPPTPSDPVPTPSGRGHLTTPSTPSSPYGGDGVRDGVSDDTQTESTPSAEIDVYDPTIQHLLDDDDPIPF